MIRKLQIKFVAMCMVLVTAVLGVVFAAVLVSAKQNIEVISHQVLERVIQDDAPNSRPALGPNQNGEEVLLPYFTVNLWDSNGVYQAFVTSGTYANLQDTAELEDILSDCLRQGQPEGTIGSYGLRYMRQDYGLYQRIAFVDMSMEQATLQELMGSYLQIGLAALILLLGVSILLARWATRPVARAWRQQRQFLSDASHELKTPLTVILSNAELLEAAPMDPRPARWADNIHSEAKRMKSLVEEMLTLARADNAVPTAVMAEVSLSDLATDCALAFEPVAFEAGKPLESDIAPDVTVTGDGDKLRQLIGVLLDNAIKYGQAGGTITLSLRRTDRQARLTVSNPGEPIPPEQLSRLFERFYRADASRGEQSGFGLGLPIAAAIASEHKGTLKAESDQVSTRFLFTMPLKK
ncbi:HAMP domain-containing sensor histidine kinase [uncultured Oscillibacter sp.]|uniref:sensor histidine kinase n=1 Tax=uncultured Oscillibacter sp. TaxID=876091 RepID=UPI001F893581|nr:HAMP domain-containing sensor histidine kinase [uncultured Oscillibacter sp.]HJB31474.1 HAMP domain-containing histidine kinase [Candidatus Oscillibacter excrementavium]